MLTFLRLLWFSAYYNLFLHKCLCRWQPIVYLLNSCLMPYSFFSSSEALTRPCFNLAILFLKLPFDCTWMHRMLLLSTCSNPLGSVPTFYMPHSTERKKRFLAIFMGYNSSHSKAEFHAFIMPVSFYMADTVHSSLSTTIPLKRLIFCYHSVPDYFLVFNCRLTS